MATNLLIRRAQAGDGPALLSYLQHLSPQTKSRFGPHPFDPPTVHAICEGNLDKHLAFLGLLEGKIVAYTIVLRDYTQGEYMRYAHYPIRKDRETDCTLAPSVADKYQSKGIGSQMYEYVEQELISLGASKIVLWGGVQARNERAVNFYRKHGFEVLGEFEHQGPNLDMVKILD